MLGPPGAHCLRARRSLGLARAPMNGIDEAAYAGTDALDALASVPTLRAVLEGLPDATVAADREGVVVFVNARAEELFGYERAQLIGQPVQALWPERVRERYVRNMELYFATEHPLRFSTEAHGLRRDGSEFVGEMSWGIVDTEAGPLLLAIGRDISARREAVARLRRQSAQQVAVAALGERALGGAHLADLSRDAVERMQQTLPLDRVTVRRDGRTLAAWSSGERSVRSVAELKIRTADEVFGAISVGSAHPDAFGDDEHAFLRGVANVLASAVSRLRDEEKMRHDALHDPLTGLANRALCRDRLSQALAGGERGAAATGAIFIDLDNFKRINDSYGHAAGDAVLVALGRRLQATVRPADTVARLGGDEFVVVCREIDDGAVLALGRRLADAIHRALPVRGVEHRLSASVGIALGVAGATTADALLADADAACYRAKAEGRARVEVFDAQLREKALERLQTGAALESALSGRQLRMAYQPIVALDGRAAVAYEALLRWDRPGGGASAPGDFIPVAEESALIVEIGTWALREACAAAAAAAGAPQVWVNLSGRQLARPELPELVAECLRQTELPAARLRLELTETVLLHAAPMAERSLQALAQLGAGVVLDDFGTGHSSLQHLRRFPVAGLKIDGSFVAGLGADEGDTAIVAAVVSLAAALKIDAVAEGVETERQAAALRELGCPLAQGFLFGTPDAAMR